MKDPYPLSPGLGAACLAAAGGAPLAFAIMLASTMPMAGILLLIPLMIVGFPIALLHVLILALPSYLLLRQFWQLTWWNSSLAGFLIGALPSTFLFFDWQASPEWRSLAMTGACGAVGGFLFWLVLRPPRTDDEELRGTFA